MAGTVWVSFRGTDEEALQFARANGLSFPRQYRSSPTQRWPRLSMGWRSRAELAAVQPHLERLGWPPEHQRVVVHRGAHPVASQLQLRHGDWVVLPDRRVCMVMRVGRVRCQVRVGVEGPEEWWRLSSVRRATRHEAMAAQGRQM
jgi:hypothetical protein